MRLVRTWLLALAVAIGAARAPASASAPRPLTVFAAASLKNALDAVDAAYAKAGGGPVSASYAASSTLARQIDQGAPADVFVSADSGWMDYVDKKGLLRRGSRHDLLTNHLALIAPKSSTVKLTPAKGFPLAAALRGGRLAMAGLDVPAGRYGQAALASLGVWDQVKGHVAFGENVRAALIFVARGEAPLGIVYDTDAVIDPNVRIVGLFPDASHPRIVYPVAVVAASKNPAAERYLAFLQGGEARAIFAKYGFRRLGR
jgi:molybdate transport system substrate-binding protein